MGQIKDYSNKEKSTNDSKKEISKNDHAIIDPTSYEENKNRGISYFEKENYLEAIPFFENAYNLKKDDMDLAFHIGQCYFKLEEFDHALIWFVKARALKKDIVDELKIMDRIGVCRFHLDRTEKSISTFEEAIKHTEEGLEDKTNNANEIKVLLAQILNNNAWVLTSSERYDEAQGLIERALELDEDSYYLDTYGFILYKQKKYDDSITNLKKAIQKDGKNHYAYFHKGLTLYAKADYDGALTSLRLSLDLDPNLPEANNAYAAALTKVGDDHLAMKYLKIAIKLKPDLAEAHENLITLTNKSQNQERFWDFWAKSNSRKFVAISLGVLAVILSGYSIYENSDVVQTVQNINTTNKVVVGNITTVTTTSEAKIPESYLIIIGIIILILLSPEVKKAKIGPVELELARDLIPAGSKS